MKNLIVSYILGAVGLVCPIAGLHRFYLDKPVSGVFYLLTWGFFGVGSIIDLVRMPRLVDETNARLLLSSDRDGYLLERKNNRHTTPEREILRVCKNKDGVVTVQMIAMETSLSLGDAKKELERLHNEGYCDLDVDEDGIEIYRFGGLVAKRPLLAT